MRCYSNHAVHLRPVTRRIVPSDMFLLRRFISPSLHQLCQSSNRYRRRASWSIHASFGKRRPDYLRTTRQQYRIHFDAHKETCDLVGWWNLSIGWTHARSLQCIAMNVLLLYCFNPRQIRLVAAPQREVSGAESQPQCACYIVCTITMIESYMDSREGNLMSLRQCRVTRQLLYSPAQQFADSVLSISILDLFASSLLSVDNALLIP